MKSAESVRSRIAEHYRSAIRRGVLAPGAALPSARTLAAEWNTAESNVHSAIASLAREGLVTRRPRAGTVVCDGANELRSVAIFLDWFHTQRGEQFTRILVEILESEFAARGVGCRVLYDTPGGAGLRELASLASSRRIQGVIARNLAPERFDFFSKLPVPFSALSMMRIPNRVGLLSGEMARTMADALAGCRRIGMLLPHGYREFCTQCTAAAAKRGMELRPEWILTAAECGEPDPDGAGYAYRAMERLWRMSAEARPDGVMVFADDLVGGIAMAQCRWHFRIPEDFRLAIHTTSENPVIFPFECTLVEQSIRQIASLLIGQLCDLRAGVAPRPGHLTVTSRKFRL